MKIERRLRDKPLVKYTSAVNWRRSAWTTCWLWIIFLLVPQHDLLASTSKFTELDSIFKVQLEKANLQELEGLLKDMQANVTKPLELGKYHYNQGIFHLKAAEFGLCLLSMEKAQVQFESVGATKLAMESQVYQANSHHFNGETDQALVISKRLVAQCLHLPADEVPLKVLRLRANLLRDFGELDSARFFLEKIAQLASMRRDSTEFVTAKLDIATTWQIQGNRKKALQIALDIEEQVINLPNFQLQIRYYNFMGMVYLALDQGTRSIENHQKALDLARKYKLKQPEASALSALALSQKVSGDTAAAIQNFNESLVISMGINDLNVASSNYTGLADIYIGLKRWSEAEKYAEKGLYYCQKSRENRKISYALMRIGEIKIGTSHFPEALQVLQQADSITRLIGNWYRVETINRLMSEAAEGIGNLEKALEYERLANIANDSVEYLDAKNYADSLLITQGPALATVETKPSKPDRSRYILLAALLLIALAGGTFWKMKQVSKIEAAKSPNPMNLVATTQIEEAEVSESDSEDPDDQPQSAKVAQESIQEVINALRQNKDWTTFMLQFDAIYPGLMENIASRVSDLSPTDLRILALSRLGLSTDEFADILGISPDSAKKARYRTRKRLGLASGQSLLQYMLQG